MVRRTKKNSSKLIELALKGNPIRITRRTFLNLNKNTTTRNQSYTMPQIFNEADIKQGFETIWDTSTGLYNSGQPNGGPWGSLSNFYPQNDLSTTKLVYGRHMYISEGKITVDLSNQANTTANFEIFYVKPRRDIPNKTDTVMGVNTDDILSLVNIFRTSWYYQISDPIGSNEGLFYDHWQNPQCDLFQFSLFTHYYKVYHSKRFKVLPGQNKRLTLKNKPLNVINGWDVEFCTYLKGFMKGLIIRIYGDMINDTSGNVGYGDYCINMNVNRSYTVYNIPMQRNPIQELNSETQLPDSIYVVNPVSGFMEAEQDTISGPQANPTQYDSGTGIPVVVTNPLTDPVPVISPPVTNKPIKKRIKKKVRYNNNNNLEEEFKDL